MCPYQCPSRKAPFPSAPGTALCLHSTHHWLALHCVLPSRDYCIARCQRRVAPPPLVVQIQQTRGQSPDQHNRHLLRVQHQQHKALLGQNGGCYPHAVGRQQKPSTLLMPDSGMLTWAVSWPCSCHQRLVAAGPQTPFSSLTSLPTLSTPSAP